MPTLDYLDLFSDAELKDCFYGIFNEHNEYNKNSLTPRLNPAIANAFEGLFREFYKRKLNIQPYFEYLLQEGDELIKERVLLSAKILEVIGFDSFMRVLKDNSSSSWLLNDREQLAYVESLPQKNLITFLNYALHENSKVISFRNLKTSSHVVDYCLNNQSHISFPIAIQSKRVYSHLVNRFFEEGSTIDSITMHLSSSRDLNDHSRMRVINRVEKLISKHENKENLRKIICVITLKKWIHHILEHQSTNGKDKENIKFLYNQQNIRYHSKYVEAQTSIKVDKMYKYLSHDDSAVRQCLANNENLPLELQHKLSVDTDELVRLSILTNPNVYPEVLESVYDNENNVSSSGMNNGSLATFLIAGHKNTSQSLLEEIASKTSLPNEVRAEALLNPHQSSSFIQNLYAKSLNENDLVMIRMIILSPHIMYDQLVELAEYEDEEILFKTLTHPNFPQSMRTLLLMDN